MEAKLLSFPSAMDKQARIVLIDDEADFCEDWRRILVWEGYDCATYCDSLEAVQSLRNNPPDLALVDLKMPGLDGLGVLGEIKKFSPDTVVVLITAYATIQTAIEAIGKGAFDYLPKPFVREQLLEAVSRGLRSRNCTAASPDLSELDFSCIIGASPAIRAIIELARKAALSDCSIVLLGESGTGKELAARAIHANSSRRSRLFLPVDCAALPETLLESELFGHEKGSFTSAHLRRAGLIETAAGGSVFLDEVTDMTPSMQAKLLRVLEDHCVRRIGGRELLAIDVRFMAATNQDLNRLVERRQFREDLFYRLNVLVIEIPPLRHRKSDIALLAQHFLKRRVGKEGKHIEGFAAATMMVLENYDWPGNVRELRNIVERACALTQSEYITPLDLPSHLLRSSVPASTSLIEGKKELIEAFERERVEDLLAKTSGNVTWAARLAAMDRAAFQRLMRKHAIHSGDFRH